MGMRPSSQQHQQRWLGTELEATTKNKNRHAGNGGTTTNKVLLLFLRASGAVLGVGFVAMVMTIGGLLVCCHEAVFDSAVFGFWTFGRFKEAELLLRVLLTLDRTLDDNKKDPMKTVFRAHLLAGLLHSQNSKLDEAETLMREVLKTHEDVRALTATKYCLALLLQKNNKLDEAEQLLREVLSGCRDVLGHNDNDTLACMRSLGTLLKEQDKPDEAEALLQEVKLAELQQNHQDNREQVGPIPVDSLRGIDDLAHALRNGSCDYAEFRIQVTDSQNSPVFQRRYVRGND